MPATYDARRRRATPRSVADAPSRPRSERAPYRRLFTVCSPASGIGWSRADQPALARSAGAVVADLAGGCLPGREPYLLWPRLLAWRAAGRVSVLRCGEGDQAWCRVLVGREVWRDDGARPRGLVRPRGRVLGARPGLGAGCGLVPAGGPGPVQDHRDGGGRDRGGDGDEGDLPAGHAADDDGLHRGGGATVPPPTGGMGRANAAGAARRRPAARRPGRPGRRPGGGWDGMGGCGSW